MSNYEHVLILGSMEIGEDIGWVVFAFGASWVTTDDVSVSQMQICSRVRRFECKRNALAAGHGFMWRTKRGRTTKGCLTDFDSMVNHHNQPNHHFHGISISTFSVFNLSVSLPFSWTPPEAATGGQGFRSIFIWLSNKKRWWPKYAWEEKCHGPQVSQKLHRFHAMPEIVKPLM